MMTERTGMKPSIQLLTEYRARKCEDEDESFVQIPTPDASPSASKRPARGRRKSAQDKEITSAVEGVNNYQHQTATNG
jgi:hypothetical protein